MRVTVTAEINLEDDDLEFDEHALIAYIESEISGLIFDIETDEGDTLADVGLTDIQVTLTH